MANPSPNPDSIALTIRYKTLIIGFSILIVIIIITAIVNHYSTYDIKFADYISICAFGSITIGLIYTAISLQYTYHLEQEKVIKENLLLKQNLKILTYSKLEQWNSPDMQADFESFRQFFLTYKGKLADPHFFVLFKSALSANAPIERALNRILIYIEILGLQISEKVIDEETVKSAMRSLVISINTNLQPYIEELQRQNSGASARVYEQIVNLANRWK